MFYFSRLFSYLLLCPLFLGLLVSAPALAEDSRYGRNPDGTAYRSDGKGGQIIDYIAELEVKNQSLMRRIYGLEEEIESLREDSKSGSSEKSSGIRERDLGGQRLQLSNRRKIPPPGRIISGQIHRNSKLSNSNSRNQLSVEPRVPSVEAVSLVKASEKATEKCEPVQCEPTECAAVCGELECQTFISEVEQRNKRVIQDRDKKLVALKSEKSDCSTEAKSFRLALAAHEKEELELRKNLKDTKAQEISLRSDLERSQKTIAQLKDEVTELKKTVATSTRAVPSGGLFQRASIVPPSEEQKKQLVIQMNQIISLRDKRDSLFKNFRSKSLVVTKQKIVTGKGKSPEQLIKEIQAMNDVRSVKRYYKEGTKLLSKVKRDISLIQRLKG